LLKSLIFVVFNVSHYAAQNVKVKKA